jgi:hypothetical protein
VLHAASQDLPCLAELGMRPAKVFDTELAGRLLGYPKVGLGSIVEEVLGLSLEKGHSAADWSTRPLPEPWLRYAALDVEVLVELRDVLAEQLDRQGKRAWAEEEFAAIVAAPPPPPKVDPWRRTSGMHRVRKRRQLAVVRSLWERRDEVARRRDIAPGRIVPDSAIVAAALAQPRTEEDLVALPVWGGRSMRRQTAQWLPAITAALELPEADLPDPKTPARRSNRRPGPGRTGNHWRRPDCPPPGPRSARWPSGSACRSRTCWPRTPSAGCAGRRPATGRTRQPWPTSSAPTVPVAGRSSSRRRCSPTRSRGRGSPSPTRFPTPPSSPPRGRRSGGGHPLVGRIWQRPVLRFSTAICLGKHCLT